MTIEIVKDGKRVAVIHNMPSKVSPTRLGLLARKYNAGFLGTWNDARTNRQAVKLAKIVRLEQALAAINVSA